MRRTLSVRRSALRWAGIVWAVLAIMSITQSQTLRFPEDDGKHDGVDFETWIVFARVQTPAAEHYRFAVFFASGKIIGLSISAVYVFFADEDLREAEHSTKIVIPIVQSATHTTGRLSEQYGNASLIRQDSAGVYTVSFDFEDSRVTMVLEPKKAAVNLGMVSVGTEKHERGYLVPRGLITGTIAGKDRKSTLTGIGMFQHLWGDSPDKKAAADMFAIHLEDGTDVAAFFSPDFPQSNRLIISGPSDLVDVQTKFTAYPESVAVGKTGIRFSVRWNLATTDSSLRISMNPKLIGQEVQMLGLPYWVQTCEADGYVGGEHLRGVAYVYLRNGSEGIELK